MGNDSYLYTGVGLISVFLIASIAFIATAYQEAGINTAKITLEFEEQNMQKEFSFYTTREKLFSGGDAINFSSVQNGFGFYGGNFKCEISCKKEESKNE